jgi:hypothetical protein
MDSHLEGKMSTISHHAQGTIDSPYVWLQDLNSVCFGRVCLVGLFQTLGQEFVGTESANK